MTVIREFKMSDPHNGALLFSAILAIDKGVESKVLPHGSGWVVLADDGQAVVFTK